MVKKMVKNGKKKNGKKNQKLRLEYVHMMSV
jgi:hypothetical protein